MKYYPLYAVQLHCNDSQQVFRYFVENLTDSIMMWDYFVNWGKVLGNVRDLEIDLNTLNYLVGKQNIEDEFTKLLEKQPQLVRTIPILLATRDKTFDILVDTSGSSFKYKQFSFTEKSMLSHQELVDIVEFTNKTGLLALFRDKVIRSVPDYVLGVEVGLDSNGRKNRGGTTMENLVGEFIKNMCEAYHYQYIKQATAEQIWQQWGMKVQVDKSSRRFDFAIRKGQTLYLVESNFYGGGGSKLKATAGEYKSLYDFLKPQNIIFIWITDGLGWKSTLRPLEETFNHIDFTLNLQMLMNGLFGEIIKMDI